MRTFTPLVALLVLWLALLAAGCEHANPVAPEAIDAAKGTPLGATVTCATKPRTYCSADGARCWLEVDTYTQTTPCPAEPID
jgi:hypothetical protein